MLSDLRYGSLSYGVQQVLTILKKNLLVQPAITLVATRLRYRELNQAAHDKLGDVLSQQYQDVLMPGGPRSAQAASLVPLTDFQYKVGSKVMHTVNRGELHNGTMGEVVAWEPVSGWKGNWLVFRSTAKAVWHRLHPDVSHLPLVAFSLTDGSTRSFLVEPLVLPDALNEGGENTTRVGVPLMPAHAITIHKAAGMSISVPTVVDFEGAASGVHALVYEALSRTRGLYQMQVKSFRDNLVAANPAAIQADADLRERSSKQKDNVDSLLALLTIPEESTKPDGEAGPPLCADPTLPVTEAGPSVEQELEPAPKPESTLGSAAPQSKTESTKPDGEAGAEQPSAVQPSAKPHSAKPTSTEAASKEAVSTGLATNAAEVAATIGNGVLVHQVPGSGWGLFADREFKGGELITLYDGDCLTRAEACGRDIQTHMTYRAGFFVDGYPVASSFRRDPQRVLGRGGGCFANHATNAAANAETYLYSRDGTGMNSIFLRVKRGRTVARGDEITMYYGAPHSMAYRVAMGTAKFESLPARQVEKVSLGGLSTRKTRQSSTELRAGSKIRFAPKAIVFTAKLTTWAVGANDWKESRRGHGISCEDYPTTRAAIQRREQLLEAASLAHTIEQSLEPKHEHTNDHVDTDSESEDVVVKMKTEEGRAHIAAKNKVVNNRGCASVEQRVHEGTLEWLGAEWSMVSKKPRQQPRCPSSEQERQQRVAADAEAKAKAKAAPEAKAMAEVQAQAEARVESQAKEAKRAAGTTVAVGRKVAVETKVAVGRTKVAVETKVAKEKAAVVASTGRILRGGAHRPPSGVVPSVVSIKLAMAPGCVSTEAHDVDTEIDVIPSAWTASPSERVLRRTQPRSIQSLVYEQEGVNRLHVRLYIDGFRLPNDGKTFIFGSSEYLEILEGRLISWYAITRTTDRIPT
jgi:hypothetical protein